MTKYILIICFFFLGGLVDAQNILWEVKKSYLNSNIEAWDVNPLGEIILESNGTLYKLDTSFQIQFTQNNARLGKITKIDAGHSLKTMVFSKDQQMVAVLDNSLSFQPRRLDLSKLGIAYATQVCYSDQSLHFWIYDQVNSQLIKIMAMNPGIVQSTISNLRRFIHSSASPILEENNQNLFLFYKGQGAYVFDYYGSLLRKFTDFSAKKMDVTEYYVYFLESTRIVRINRQTGARNSISLPTGGIVDFRVFGGSIYLKDNFGIKKYTLTEPD